MTHPSDNTLVIIPTYNEKDNLPLIVGRLRKAEPDRVNILVVDDNSPDGTGDLADQMAADDSHIYVLHRKGKEGLCAAYVAGFRWGLSHGYDVICEMDADGSHAPEQLHLLLDSVNDGADLTIGSRYVAGGKTVNWPASRQFLSRGGNAYINIVLGAGIRDITAGYRAYRRAVLDAIDLDELSNAGYIFQTDLAWRVLEKGFDVREVPITFTERELGESKLSGNFVKDSLLEVTKWGLDYRSQQAKDLFTSSKRLIGHEVKEFIEKQKRRFRS
ncbi:polyprenol monophosphomannose synthase [Corynebacterium kroppenstedtii]|uniref:polyprenol monophosphomannose synthase n=1 Tax=Corynebacterium sp. PCR 32 TaxID=3351342 RepID=UPI0030A0E19E